MSNKVIRDSTGKEIVKSLNDITNAISGTITSVDDGADDTSDESSNKVVLDDTGEEIGNSLKDITNAIKSKVTAPAIINSVSGAIASFEDGAEDMPLDELKVYIEPVQEGTGDPSPDNVRPITGRTGVTVTRTGKNLFHLGSKASTISVNGITVTPNSDNTITVNGTNTGNSLNVQLDFGSWDNTPLLLKKRDANYEITYSIKINGTINGKIDFYGGYIDKNRGSHQYSISSSTLSETITIPKDATRLRTWFNIPNNASASNATIKIQAEFGSTATEYEPYQGNVYDITLPTEAGTVYGGELTVHNDGTGELVVDRRIVTAQEINESSNTNFSYVGGGGVFVYRVEDAEATSPSVTNQKLVCNILSTTNQNYLNNAGNYGRLGCAIWWTKNIGIAINESISNVNNFKQWCVENDIQLVYPIATPITYTLTPAEITTLLGENHVWSDAGDVDVSYRADTKLYIDSKIAEAIAAALNV